MPGDESELATAEPQAKPAAGHELASEAGADGSP